MIQKNEYLQALVIINEYKKQLLTELKNIPCTLEDRRDLYLIDADISTRLLNTLRCAKRTDTNKYYDLHKDMVSELAYLSLKEFQKNRNVGNKTIQELIGFCKVNNITLLP